METELIKQLNRIEANFRKEESAAKNVDAEDAAMRDAITIRHAIAELEKAREFKTALKSFL